MKPFELQPADATRYTVLRRAMLASDPWAFSATIDDDRGLDIAHLENALAEEFYLIIGIEDEAKTLLASCGLIRSTNPKHSHRATVWGVYTTPNERGKGHGKSIIEFAIESAKGWGVEFIDLGVSENAPEARSLYEKLGFVEWGREPESTDIDGVRYDEIFLTLCVREK